MRRRTPTIAALLGITQREMSLLLRVTRAQWSMYELGKRNLPLKTKQLLAEMLVFLRVENKGPKVVQHLIEQQELKKKCLEKLLRENEYQLYVIGKKIAPIESKYNSNLVAIGVVEYLTTNPPTTEALDGELLSIISGRAERTIRKSGLADLTVLKMKEELLQQEKLLLGSALNKVTRTLQELRDGQLSYS
ncbi:MAG: helix-turn-helix transcriptional regulator [Flavobacterium sp. JAD_PAG50586_2]|nr:MAG: helix-turn-helix transcriptional regulator [Flavobacterium sp. JAD_PAG50586_2]